MIVINRYVNKTKKEKSKMATFIQISQGFASNEGIRKTSKVWSVVNTTLEDEQLLMTHGFLPILVNQDDVPEHKMKLIETAFDRFFNKGMFLLMDQYEVINEMLDFLGYQQIEIKEDGKYFQPTLPGRYKPCAKSWENNGVARARELTKIHSDWKNNKIQLNKLKTSNNSIESFMTE